MNKFTPQEAFNLVVRHARRQRAISRRRTANDDAAWCAYRGDNGAMCFVGVLIPNHLYNPWIERRGVAGLPGDVRGALYGLPTELLRRLQDAHDRHPVNRWEIEFRRIARDFKLTIPPPTDYAPLLPGTHSEQC